MRTETVGTYLIKIMKLSEEKIIFFAYKCDKSDECLQ